MVSVYPSQQYPRESLRHSAGAFLEARLTPTCDLRGKTCLHRTAVRRGVLSWHVQVGGYSESTGSSGLCLICTHLRKETVELAFAK